MPLHGLTSGCGSGEGGTILNEEGGGFGITGQSAHVLALNKNSAYPAASGGYRATPR